MKKRTSPTPKSAELLAKEAADKRAAARLACQKISPGVFRTFTRAIEKAAGCETAEAESLFEEMLRSGEVVLRGGFGGGAGGVNVFEIKEKQLF